MLKLLYKGLWIQTIVYIISLVSFSVPAGPVLETTVGDNVNSLLLLNLLAGTEYSVQLTALYPTGQSEPLFINAKTCKYSHVLSLLVGITGTNVKGKPQNEIDP